MELSSFLPGEPLPLLSDQNSHNNNMAAELQQLSDEEIQEKVETLLLEKIKAGDRLAYFQLGQLYFEQRNYGDAKKYFEKGAKYGDYQAMFQLGVIHYDGLVGKPDHKSGFEYMLKIASSTNSRAKHLQRASQFNVGRAYYQGYGVKHSDELAEKYWLMAADDGSPNGSIKAQTMLGMLYCKEEMRDLKKSFFWHSEACGNNSLESQGALGVMYLHGLGCKKNSNSAFICLREAAERGNVYAMGNLVSYYYRRKLYTKTVELAARVSTFEDVEQIAGETDCLPGYVAKGIAMACFYYGRCLHLGLGVKLDKEEAKAHYSRSYQFDPDVCARLQNVTQHGEI